MRQPALLCSLLFFPLLSSMAAIAQSSQSYLNDVGSTAYGINIPVENGFINISNGNLHLEFPLASHPQRGALALNQRITYDSRIWMFLPFGSNGSYHWWPNNVPGTTSTSGGWQFVQGNEVGTISSTYGNSTSTACPYPMEDQYLTVTTSSVIWTDPNGTVHPFNANITQTENDCSFPYNPVSYQSIGSGAAADGSGYFIRDDGSGNPLVTDNNGTQVYPQIIDRYGNYWSSDAQGNLVDATGRVPVITTQNGNTTYYDVLSPNGPINNQGTRVRYTVTTAPITVNTDFVPWQYSDIHQWSGTLYPVQSIGLPDGSQYSFGYNDVDGELTSITLPSGGTISYGYSNFFDSSTTENRLLTSRTVGSNPATTYTPSVVAYCANYSNGCIEHVTVHKPSGDETVYQLTLNNGAWNTGTTVYDGSVASGRKLLQTTSFNTYTNGCTNGNPCYGANYLSQTLATTARFANPASSAVYTQTQSFFNLSVGKISDVKEWDYVSSSPSTTTPPSSTPARETQYTYTGNDVQQVTVLGNGVQAGQTTYGYTTSPAQTTSGVAQHGSQNAGGPYLQTVSHAWIGGTPSTLITNYGMDDTGQVISTSDPKGNPPATVSYQCANSLPYQSKNALNQTTQYGYDCSSGAVTSVKDPNDLAAGRNGTTYAYEGAGRLQSISYPDGGQTSYSYPSATEVDTTVLATPSPSIVSQDFVDSFGRKYQHIQAGASSETTYDANGRVYCATNPHFTGSASSTDGSTCMTAYDGLDRPITQQQPDGTTLGWSYSGATTISSDEAGKQWQRTSDAFGHLVKVVEPGNYTTTYAYDGLGNLQTVNQGGVAGSDTPRVRTFLYDSLSRLTNECHPEGIPSGQTCSSNGPWSTSYSYDLNGNAKTQTDARGVTATLSYDALNRLYRKTFSDGTPGQFFGYDQTSVWMGTQSNTIGRLSQSATDQDMRYFGSGSAPGCNPPSSATANFNPANGNPTYCQWTDELYSYDAMGRTSRVGTAPPSEAGWLAHGTDIAYDLAGNMIAMLYPDGRVIGQSWDGGGRLQNVIYGNWQGQNVSYTYASGFTYTPAGAQAEVTTGNGIYTHTPYNNRQQLCQVWVANPQQNFIDKHYMYGDSSQYCASTPSNNGTISQLLDMRNGNRSQGFSYDGLNRLSAFSSGDGTMQQSYPMDAFGNLQQSGTASFQVGLNAKNQFSTGGFGYDQAGNMTTANLGLGQTIYQFDGANRLFNVNAGTNFYTYDAAGERMRKDTANGWTEYQYLNGQVIAEKTSDGAWSDYIYANGHKIARADAYDAYIHTHGTTPGGVGASWNIATPNYVIKHDDRLIWRQYQAGGGCGGPNIQFGNTQTHEVLQDTNGLSVDDWPNQNQWASRVAVLNGYVGLAITMVQVVTDNCTPAGTWDIYYGDLAIVSTDGTVTPLYFRQTGGSFANPWNQGHTNLSAIGEKSITSASAMGAGYNTTYFQGDHLGSARMLTAGEGFPVESDTFYPFGQSPAPNLSPNHYQYAGLERDPETGLDHATFRQYSPTMGRWMSPDPYNGSIDLGNPQSLNRYNYVGNNPMTYTDPSGLLPIGCGFGVSGGGEAAITVGFGVGTGGMIPAVAGAIGCGLYALDEIINLFHHPKFTGSTKSRPGAIWDEHGGYQAHADISGALGLPDNSCEFGACGFLPQSGPAIQKYSSQFVDGVSFIFATYNEMVKANTIGADRYFHCKSMYGATEIGPGGQLAAHTMSWGREAGDTVKYQVRRLWGKGLHLSDSLEDSMGDLTADYMGIRGAAGGASLEGSCGSLRVRGIP